MKKIFTTVIYYLKGAKNDTILTIWRFNYGRLFIKTYISNRNPRRYPKMAR